MKKRKAIIPFVALALGGALLGVLLCYEPIEEGRCTLKHGSINHNSQLMVATLAWQLMEPEPSRPDGFPDPPAGFEQPWFYEMKTGDGTVPVLLDLSAEPRLCLDANRDGSLVDERQYSVRKLKAGGRDREGFGPIHMSPAGQANRRDLLFYAFLYSRDGARPMWLVPASYRHGKLRLDGAVYQVAVVDGNYNGRFDSTVSLPWANLRRPAGWDALAIDRDGDGQFSCSFSNASDVMPLSALVRVAEKYYAVNLAADGSTLELTPAQPVLGRLALDPADATFTVRLWSDAADQYLARPARQWDLPAGRYQGLAATLYLLDADGNNWTFSTAEQVGPLHTFEIASSQTTQMQLGPPFVVATEATPVEKDRVYIALTISGCGNEQYQGRIQRSGQAIPRPTFKIVSEDGTVLTEDRFEYG